MNYELIKRYIGKECIIYTMNSQIAGTVKEITEGWMSIDNGKDVDAVNLDYVVRVREYPTKRNGRKKSIVVD